MKVLLAVCLLCLVVPSFGSWSSIKHVVVLMLENRSFDHMLGFLKTRNPEINGPTGHETNPVDPSNPNSKQIPLSFGAEPHIGFDPSHSFGGTATEMFGSETPVWPAPMNGFVKANGGRPAAMHCYNSSTTPAIHTLGMEFAVFDAYYSSIPGPTQPNRQYIHSGTSHGYTSTPSTEELAAGYPQRVIYEDFHEAGVSWKAYFSDVPVLAVQREVRKYIPTHFHTLEGFKKDARSGTLPSYSWVEPRWFATGNWKQNDQHPPASSTDGEFLIAEIYEELRAGPGWNDTLFIITYDEHGGLYDHVEPPRGAPNPDGMDGKNGFKFDRLGVRVPVVMASPRIPRGTVYHNPKKNFLDHSSVMATCRKIFNMTQPPLTKREAWVGTFEDVVTLAEPRADCPATLPVPNENGYKAYLTSQSIPLTEENIARMLAMDAEADTREPITGLQYEALQAASLLTGGDAPFAHIKYVNEAAAYVYSQVSRVFGHLL